MYSHLLLSPKQRTIRTITILQSWDRGSFQRRKKIRFSRWQHQKRRVIVFSFSLYSTLWWWHGGFVCRVTWRPDFTRASAFIISTASLLLLFANQRFFLSWMNRYRVILKRRAKKWVFASSICIILRQRKCVFVGVDISCRLKLCMAGG